MSTSSNNHPSFLSPLFSFVAYVTCLFENQCFVAHDGDDSHQQGDDCRHLVKVMHVACRNAQFAVLPTPTRSAAMLASINSAA